MKRRIARDLQPIIRQATMPSDADAEFSQTYGKEPLRLVLAAAGFSYLRDADA